MKWIVTVFVFILPIVSQAEEEAKVLGSAGGFYMLEIDKKIYRAMTNEFYLALEKGVKGDTRRLTEQVQKLTQQLQEARLQASQFDEHRKKQQQLTSKYQDLNKDFSQLNTEYAKTSDELVQINNQYRQTIGEFDTLIDKYRDVAVRTHPRSSLDLGLGFLSAGGSSYPFLMAGSGLKLIKTEVRGWLMLGTDSYGAMVGVSF